MKFSQLLIGFLVLCVICGPFVLAGLALFRHAPWRKRRSRMRGGARLEFANIAEGTRKQISKRAVAALGSRYLLVIRTTDDDHVGVAGASDKPYLLCTDGGTNSAAEDLVACQPLQTSEGTVKLVTDGGSTLAIGDLLIPATGGKVKKALTSASTQWIVGIVQEAVAATDGVIFEAVPLGQHYTITA